MVSGIPESPHQLKHSPGQVRCGRIDQCLQIGERNLVQQVLGVVLVEGGPAAVLTLHTEAPVDPPLYGFILAVADLYILDRHHDETGIVYIGVPVVLEFEGPPSRLQVGRLDLPVSRNPHFHGRAATGQP